MTPESLTTYNDAAKRYADARATLAVRVSVLEARIQKVHSLRLPGIRKALAEAKDAQAALAAVIEAAPADFEKPRTITLHGVKLGMQKAKGSIEWDDDEVLSRRIQLRHPDQYEILVKVTRKPIVKALNQLTTAELRKLGCSVTEAGDAPYIKAEDTALDKLISRLLKEGKGRTDADSTEEGEPS